MNSYKTVLTGSDAVIEIKKSRFIAALRPAEDEAEALRILEEERKKYYDAKHHCSAYLLYCPGKDSEIPHSSDDGEPSGTAGKPILEVIRGAGLKNVICVVTRYFGGTLLGTGGLVRAYTEAARASVEAAELTVMALREKLELQFDYSFTGKADYIIGKFDCTRENAEYGQDVTYSCTVKAEEAEKLCAELTEASAGKIVISRGKVDFYPSKL